MKNKQLILLGPPGSGAGAQAITLAKRWQIPHVVVDELSGGEGATTDDQALIKLLRKRFEQPDVMLQGYVLSGFPKTRSQAVALDELLSSFGLPAADVAYIKASTGILINRLSTESGNDVSVSMMRKRISDYKEGIMPVMEYYQQQSSAEPGPTSPRLKIINGSQSAAEIENALSMLDQQVTGAARYINEDELDQLAANEAVLVVDCVASWCGPCKQVSPLIDRLAQAYSDRATVVKLDFDNNRQVAKRFGLKGMPSVMFFKQGELQETLTGMKPYSVYDKAMSQLL